MNNSFTYIVWEILEDYVCKNFLWQLCGVNAGLVEGLDKA